MVIIIVKKLWGNEESNNSFSKFPIAVAIKAWYYLFETRRVANRIQIKFFITSSVYNGKSSFHQIRQACYEDMERNTRKNGKRITPQLRRRISGKKESRDRKSFISSFMQSVENSISFGRQVPSFLL